MSSPTEKIKHLRTCIEVFEHVVEHGTWPDGSPYNPKHIPNAHRILSEDRAAVSRILDEGISKAKKVEVSENVVAQTT